MSERSDAELLLIVSEQRDDYQPEALKAAEEELLKRNLSTEQVLEAEEVNQEKKRIAGLRDNEPLEVYWKILTALFPGIFQLVLAGGFRREGYSRKAKDLKRWTLFGFGLYSALLILMIFFIWLMFQSTKQ